MAAAITFAACDLLIGELGSLGLYGNYYYNTGGLIFSIGYFIKTRACASSKEEKKAFYLCENGKFNW